jgi:hypothetical protein
VDWKYREVNVKVKFKFLADSVLLSEGKGHKTVPGDKEVLSFAESEGLEGF